MQPQPPRPQNDENFDLFCAPWSTTSQGRQKVRVDGVKFDEDATAPVFPVFAPSAISREPLGLRRRDFDGRASFWTLYLPTSPRNCARIVFDSSTSRGREVLIGSAYFRPPDGSNDFTIDFPTPENPHPKITKLSHYQPEVTQNDAQSSKMETAKLVTSRRS